jgi:polysaccharide export outer membrane protein
LAQIEPHSQIGPVNASFEHTADGPQNSVQPAVVWQGFPDDVPAGTGAPIPAYPQEVTLGTVVPTSGGLTVQEGDYSVYSQTSPVRAGVECIYDCPCEPSDWDAERCINWQPYAQGEYVGPPRTQHVPEYRLRVDDVLEFIYRLTAQPSAQPYRLEVGDTLRVESLTSENLNRDVIVQPDGAISLRLLGQVPAAGRTVDELRLDLDERYQQMGGVRDPSITVTPLVLNTRLVELRNTVDNRYGSGGQSRQTRVTPEGTVQLPAIGSVPVQGLTLDEVKMEVEARYEEVVRGIEITPVLMDRAPRFIYVVGEVAVPGRFVLEGPTTVMQAIALAGSWNIGAQLRHVVVLRRDDNWQLMATRLDLHRAFFGKEPCPEDEIWLRDSDIVIVPKRPIQWTGDLIEMFFTRGVYGVVPAVYSFQFAKLSTL